MKQKILVIASYAKSLVNFRFAMMKAFQESGANVIACAPADDAVAAQLNDAHIQFIPIPVKRTSLNPLPDLFLMFHLYKIFKKEKPDIIFNYTIKPVIYGSLMGKLSGVPRIYSMITGLGYVFSTTTLTSRIIALMTRPMFRQALKWNQRVFFQNPDNLAVYCDQRILVQPKKAVLINGSGVDVNAYSPTQFKPPLTFLMISRLLIDKGIREYVAAATIVKEKYPHVSFLLVGWFDENPNAITKKEYRDIIHSKVVNYLGKAEDVRPAIAESSVYVLPSYSEGMPRTVLEAMAMGRPIITTDVPGCRQTVQEGLNGFCVPAKNIQDLVEAMYKFIHNPELIEMMGKASRDIVLEKFDVNKVNSVILEYIMC